MMAESTDKTGWLLKYTGKAFKKQWFVFKPSERVLLNYNREDEAQLGKAPAGFVDMTAYILEREAKPGYENAVRLVDQNYKPTYIASEVPQELEDWIQALTTVGKRVRSDPADLQRKDAARKRQETISAAKEKEKDDAEYDKQQTQHRKQKRQLERKQDREAYNIKKKSSRDVVDLECKHGDNLQIMDLDHKEEAEDLVEKITDKNDTSPKDPLAQKWKRQQKQLDRKHARETLTLQRKNQKKAEDTKWKQDDELSRTQLDHKEEAEDLSERHDSERKSLAEKQQESREKLEQKCFEQIEKMQDDTQARREKAQLVKAAAEVIAKEGPTKSVKEIQKLVGGSGIAALSPRATAAKGPSESDNDEEEPVPKGGETGKAEDYDDDDDDDDVNDDGNDDNDDDKETNTEDNNYA